MKKIRIFEAFAGIDCNVIKDIGRTLWIPGQPENKKLKKLKQYSIFDYL